MNLTPEKCDSQFITTLFSTISDTIILTDPKFNIIFFNKQLSILSGYETFDLEGKSLESLLFCQDKGGEIRNEFSSKRGVVSKEIRLRTKAGAERDVLFYGSAVCTKRRRIVGFVCVLHDITEAKRANSIAAIGEFARIIAKDIRNPLQGTQNAAYLLKKRYAKMMDTSAIEFLDIINNNTALVNDIVSTLLECSGELNLFFANCNLKSVITCSILNLEIPKNVTVYQRLDEIDFFGDASKIQQVFTHIIKNSIEAMPEGGIIEIYSCLSQHSIEILVRDSGVGISQDVLMRLFTPLVTTKPQGLGFGLAFCKRVLDAHGGTISVLSTFEGKGTVFLVTLPIVVLSCDSKHEGN